MASASQLVTSYLRAWSENDDTLRGRLLDECWNKDGSIEIGSRRADGRDAVEADIRTFRGQAPDHRAVLTSDIQQVGRWLRFTAAIERPDSSRYSEVLDLVELDGCGRIRRIVTFPPP